MTTTTTVYKLKKLTHAQIVATAKVVVYRKAMLEKSQDVDKKVQFAIADRFYKNTVRPKAEKPDPPKTTTLKMAYDEASFLFYSYMIYLAFEKLSLYDYNMIDALKNRLHQIMV